MCNLLIKYAIPLCCEMLILNLCVLLFIANLGSTYKMISESNVDTKTTFDLTIVAIILLGVIVLFIIACVGIVCCSEMIRTLKIVKERRRKRTTFY